MRGRGLPARWPRYSLSQWFLYIQLAEVRPLEGFEWHLLIAPFSMHCVDMPRPAERSPEHKNLMKRCASSQSLGIFRLQGETFLLCYDSECSVWSLQLLCVTGFPIRTWGLYRQARNFGQQPRHRRMGRSRRARFLPPPIRFTLLQRFRGGSARRLRATGTDHSRR